MAAASSLRLTVKREQGGGGLRGPLCLEPSPITGLLPDQKAQGNEECDDNESSRGQAEEGEPPSHPVGSTSFTPTP